jgi:hypothetical protein
MQTYLNCWQINAITITEYSPTLENLGTRIPELDMKMNATINKVSKVLNHLSELPIKLLLLSLSHQRHS